MIYSPDPIPKKQNLLQSGSSPIQVHSNAHLFKLHRVRMIQFSNCILTERWNQQTKIMLSVHISGLVQETSWRFEMLKGCTIMCFYCCCYTHLIYLCICSRLMVHVHITRVIEWHKCTKTVSHSASQSRCYLINTVNTQRWAKHSTSTQWRTQKISEGGTFRPNLVMSQINFRWSAEGMTIEGGPEECPRENFAKLHPKICIFVHSGSKFY